MSLWRNTRKWFLSPRSHICAVYELCCKWT